MSILYILYILYIPIYFIYSGKESSAREKLLHIKRKHTVIFNKRFQLIPHHHLPNAGGCAGKDDITDINREEIRDIGHDLVKIVDHVGRIALLDQFLVLIQTEIDILLVLDIAKRDPFPDHGGII